MRPSKPFARSCWRARSPTSRSRPAQPLAPLARHGRRRPTAAWCSAPRSALHDCCCVSEVIAASHMGIPVLGISCITNMAAGILKQKLTHQEVIDTTTRVQAEFTRLVLGLIAKLGQ